MAEKKQSETSEKILVFRVLEGGLRVDRYLGDQLTRLSRTRIEDFFKENRVFINGGPCKKSEKIKPGDQVTLTLPKAEVPTIPEADPEILSQIIPLYEDEWLLAISKPSGISVHPGSGEREFTVSDYFARRHPEAAALFADADRPGIVHRLDKDTSGILLLAKSPEAVDAMQDGFRDRQIDKTYLAWVDGVVKTPFRRISTPIIRHPRQRIRYTTARPDTPGAREALTEVRLLAVRGGKSFLRIRLFTGRTHQIRVHMSSIGHPVCGDRLYGSPTVTPESNDPGIMLHAHELSFIHPYLERRIDLFAILPRRMRLFWQAPAG
jgi:23S rRNA pseudouridine1911/1915/1917 synthase